MNHKTDIQPSLLLSILFVPVGLLFSVFGLSIFFNALNDSNKHTKFIDLAGPATLTIMGIGAICFGIHSIRLCLWIRQAKHQHPDKPWLQNQAWARGEVKNSALPVAIFASFFTLIFNIIAGLHLFSLSRAANMEWYSATPLIAIGAGAALYTCNRILFWYKYRTSTFKMTQIPGRIGGTLNGLILVRVRHHPSNLFRLKLRNYSEVMQGRKRIIRKTVWESEHDAPMGRQFNSGSIPVEFSIPSDCFPTGEVSETKGYHWQLTISRKSRFINFKASFIVPVFKAPDAPER